MEVSFLRLSRLGNRRHFVDIFVRLNFFALDSSFESGHPGVKPLVSHLFDDLFGIFVDIPLHLLVGKCKLQSWLVEIPYHLQVYGR